MHQVHHRRAGHQQRRRATLAPAIAGALGADAAALGRLASNASGGRIRSNNRWTISEPIVATLASGRGCSSDNRAR
eukprot:13045836-Alexandrium_andersonii.AAC.1